MKYSGRFVAPVRGTVMVVYTACLVFLMGILVVLSGEILVVKF